MFADAWLNWASATVIAVEPSVAMIAEAAAPDVYVRGVAEALPLADASVDIVWVSTALHHFSNVTQAVAQFRRVLREHGSVLIRTHLPERTAIEFFSGPHTIHGVGTFAFLHKHLKWPEPKQ